MSQHSKRSIRITNPRPGEAGFVTRRSALRMIRRNVARKAGDDAVELLGDGADPRISPSGELTSRHRAHGPSFEIIERSLASGRYRNDVLGLPNFVGIQPGRRNAGRTMKAA